MAETHPYVVSLIKKAEDENADFLYHAPTFIIVYGSVVMGYPMDEPKQADPRKDVIHIIR